MREREAGGPWVRAGVVAAVLVVAGWVTMLRADNVVVPPLGEAKGEARMGVAFAFEQGGKTDHRSGRLLALHVPEKTAPTPFLSAGPFKATLSSAIGLRLRGEYTFQVLGRGTIAIKVNGAPMLEAAGEDFAGKASGVVKLNKGSNPIEVVYAAPAAGDAWFRVLWTSRDFPPEPVQPTVLTYDASAQPLREAARLREGRALLAELRCTKCHTYPVPNPQPQAIDMPELGADAPNLTAAGARLTEAWMAAWVADPHGLRPDAAMPKAVKSAQEAADVAAYLSTLGAGGAVAKEPEVTDAAVAQGGQVFAGLGCVGCHTKPDVGEVGGEGGRVPLHLVNAKYRPGALKAWLMEPQAHYQWTRMPNFRLTDLEADALVAYLRKNAAGALAASDVKGDAGKGRALFTAAECANCHEAGGAPRGAGGPELAALVETSDWAKGCLAAADDRRGAAPDFRLGEAQRGALKAFAAAKAPGLFNEVPAEFAARSFARLGCAACHTRDEVEDRWTTLNDEVAELLPAEENVESDQTEAPKGPRLFVPRGLGALHGGDQILVGGDQTRPALTWAGEKLRADWAARFVAGEVAYKPRYWMRARMPAFPRQARLLAAGMAHEHGLSAVPEKLPKADEEQAEAGRRLVSRDGGFACITCHSVNDTRAASPFEAPAPNLLHASERLTHDYYTRWMRKPMRFQPGTKMPQYSENGKTELGEPFGGDADRQFKAIWQYVLQGEKMVPPE